MAEELGLIIQEEIRKLQSRIAIQNVIVSGGAFCSQYLTRQLYARSGHMPNVLIVDEPELAIAKGLIIMAIRQPPGSTPSRVGRRCQNSIGILCKVPYKSDKHCGWSTSIHPLTRKLIVEEIDWFVKKVRPYKYRDSF